MAQSIDLFALHEMAIASATPKLIPLRTACRAWLFSLLLMFVCDSCVASNSRQEFNSKNGLPGSSIQLSGLLHPPGKPSLLNIGLRPHFDVPHLLASAFQEVVRVIKFYSGFEELKGNITLTSAQRANESILFINRNAPLNGFCRSREGFKYQRTEARSDFEDLFI